MSETTTSLWKTFIAGGCSGITAIATGQPFDTVKVRLQTQPLPEPGQNLRYAGAIDCVLKTIRNDGFFGLYKGMAVPVMVATPIFAVSFFGFNLGKKLQQKSPGETLSGTQIFIAGMLAGVFTSTLVTPGDRIKCILQVQTASSGPKIYNGPLDVARALYRQGGIMTFYTGLGATLLRDVPGGGTFYLTYVMVRRALSPEGRETDLSPLQILIAGGMAGVVSWFVAIPSDVLKSRIQTGMSVPIILSSPVFAVSFFGFNLGKRLQQSDPEETLATVQIFTAGMLSGIFASTLLTPGERIKCLLQVQTTNAGPKLYNSPIDVARDLYRRGGIKTFYKGFGATLARDIPGLGVYYLTYTMMRDVLSSEIGDIDLSPLQILIAGGVAGVLSWIVSIPTDVMKSRIQTAPEGKYPHGMRSVFVDLMRHEGPSALFKGTVPMLLRAFPSSAVSFLGYEGAMNLLTCLAHDE